MSSALFVPTGMRTKVEAGVGILVVNTCSGNESSAVGDLTHWTWANPTNRRFLARHPHNPECCAVSVEALWQGCKVFAGSGSHGPDTQTLAGNWRRGKGRRPLGAWEGPGRPLLTTPGAARRSIYLPAYQRQLDLFMALHEVQVILARAREHERVYLRDFDMGQGVDRNAPMSHAWVLACYLNTGRMPGLEEGEQQEPERRRKQPPMQQRTLELTRKQPGSTSGESVQ